MERENREIIKTNDAAEILKVKPSTIHKYVKEGKLKPVYESNWHIDTSKMFYLDEVYALKQSLDKPGITTGQAAKFLGLKQVTVFQYIQKGILKASKKKYRGREIFFIEPEDLEQFKSNYEERKKQDHKEFYDRKTGYAWFQQFKDTTGKQVGRILLDETGEPALYINEVKIPYEDIETKGFKPARPIKEIDYKTRKGIAKFRFVESHETFEAIELFYHYLGPKNMRVANKGDRQIEVEIKPVLIEEDIPESIYHLLDESIVEGSIEKRLKGIFIDSDVEVLAVPVPIKLKNLIREDAKKSESTIEDLVVMILKERYGLYDAD